MFTYQTTPITADDEQSANDWIDLVAYARRVLRPHEFDTWVQLIGGGTDADRVKKGRAFLDHLRPTHNADIRINWNYG